MSKSYSKKFWIIFWITAILLLVGWYFLLRFKNQRVETISSTIDYLPIEFQTKQDLKAVVHFVDYLLKNDNQEKVFLILFQNNMELRPGGGYIGSFGILKTKNGKILEIQTHDLSNFDGRIPSTIEPPYPMKETLHIDSWKLRDSNWSPDFKENANKADYFYRLGQGQENFDGIVAINTNVLNSFLEITGPITLPNYPGVYDSENAILTLEYQVEKGYAQQGIERGERKSIMNELASEIMKKISTSSNSQKYALAKIILEDLNRKDIQLYFKDAGLENQAQKSGWAGEIKSDWKNDYLMIVDANLGSYKSDYYMQRKFDYKIDLSKEMPKVDLKVTYTHTGKVKDWMTRDYLTYLRVYTPKDAWLLNSKGLGEIKFGTDFEKKSFGSLVHTALNSSTTVEFEYSLPKDFDRDNYDLLIQKQSGAGDATGHITIINKDGKEKSFDITLTGDWKMSEAK